MKSGFFLNMFFVIYFKTDKEVILIKIKILKLILSCWFFCLTINYFNGNVHKQNKRK